MIKQQRYILIAWALLLAALLPSSAALPWFELLEATAGNPRWEPVQTWTTPILTAEEAAAIAAPAQQEEEEPTVETAPPLVPPARSGLLRRQRERYRDGVGWLVVPGTDIDHLTVQSADPTNEYYLNHDLDRNPDPNGTYSINSACRLGSGSRQDLPQNIAVFAHNHDDDPDGILFAQLRRFLNPDFAREHPYLFFSTQEEDLVWEIFAVFHTKKDFPYINPNMPWYEFEGILEAARAASLYRYEAVPGRQDQILTLSTCVFDVPGRDPMPITRENDYRFVVMAKLLEPEEAVEKEAAFSPNQELLLPDEFPRTDYYANNYLLYQGQEYYYDYSFWRAECAAPVDTDRLLPVGSVVKQADPLTGDWEATRLPPGTEILQDPSYPDLLLADVDGDLIPYIPDWSTVVTRYRKMILEREDGSRVEKEMDEGLAARLEPFLLSVSGNRLMDNPDSILYSGGDRIIYEEADGVTTWTIPFQLGTPPSLGREVMVKRQIEGDYYREADVFHQLVALLVE